MNGRRPSKQNNCLCKTKKEFFFHFEPSSLVSLPRGWYPHTRSFFPTLDRISATSLQSATKVGAKARKQGGTNQATKARKTS